MEVSDAAEPLAKEVTARGKRQIREGLLFEFGNHEGERKLQDFMELGAAPFSVVAFHNKFLSQVRQSFVMGSYYPALTGACALGERILNHLLLKLRGFYSTSPEDKKVYNKDSFDDWDVPISVLSSWGVLLPEAAKGFAQLKEIRHRTLHFHPEVDKNDRSLALEAIKKLSEIIEAQFGAFGRQPWFAMGFGGAAFIRKSHESDPFVKLVYLPNCALVGPFHRLECLHGKWIAHDDYPYESKEVTDDEFVAMFNDRASHPRAL